MGYFGICKARRVGGLLGFGLVRVRKELGCRWCF